MGDLTKILDGTVEEVKAALAGVSHVDLGELRSHEVAGKNRSGVLSAIDTAAALLLDAGANSGSTAGDDTASTGGTDNGIPPAETIDTSGAPQQVVPDVDMSHPAIDADPRADTTTDQNRIDMNDNTRPGYEIVTEQLKG